jgi:hypothetical protein
MKLLGELEAGPARGARDDALNTSPSSLLEAASMTASLFAGPGFSKYLQILSPDAMMKVGSVLDISRSFIKALDIIFSAPGLGNY